MPAIETKKILADQFLRVEGKDESALVELDGVPLQVFAAELVKTGAKDPVAETIDGSVTTWVFVEATTGQNAVQRKGFVSQGALVAEGAAVEGSAGFQPFSAKVEKAAFADACYVQAELNDTNPAYLYALAFVQSGSQWSAAQVATNDPADALAIGVYQFTKETWAKLLTLADASGLTAAQIKFPTAQCVVAAILASKSASLLKGLVTDRGLSAVDLYLAHLFVEDNSFGSNAAAKILQAEKENKAQPSGDVIKQIFQDEAVRTAFLKRNAAIFKADGSATIEQALKTSSDRFVTGFEEVKKIAHEISASIPSEPTGPVFGGVFSGKTISVTDEDVDALGRVAHSEVGNFGKFGDQELTDALAAVVDTIFNRVVYHTTEFPKTVQGAIDQKQQFSAINPLGTWKKLPTAPAKNQNIVRNHVQGRARGAASKIGGALHFFNPHISNPPWGQAVKDKPTAKYGKPDEEHIHGFPKGYSPPEAYAIQFGPDTCVFSGDGKPQGQLVKQDKSVASILAATLKEWDFWGKAVEGKKKGHKDDDEAFATYVFDTYCKPLNSTEATVPKIQNDKYPWSAVCVSYILRQAGLTKAEFSFAEGHSVYIREAIKARGDSDKSKAYWGYRIDAPEAVLAPGDLVGAGREDGMTFEQAQKLFDRKDEYKSHCDIVVAVRPNAADVIGGNVSDSVTMKTLRLDNAGRLNDQGSLAFVVMKKNKPA